MIKYILKIGVVILVMLTSSCNKWLDLQPQDGITKKEFWKTKEDVKAALYGMYSSVIENGTVLQRIFLWGELRADMIDVTQATAAEEFNQIRNSNIQSTNSISSWTAVYKVINNCNLIIDFAKDVKALDPTFTDALYNSYVGEALTMRSLMYFYLVRTFRDVPLKLNGSFKDTDIKEIGKQNADVVLAQIIKDLEVAEAMVPEKHGNDPIVNKGRITKYAVKALLADVYLWNEQYDKTIEIANEVIDSQEYTLLNTSGAWFDNVFVNGGAVETILEFNNSSLEGNSFNNMLLSGSKTITASNFVKTDFFKSNMLIDTDLSDGRGEGVFLDGTSSIIKYGRDNTKLYNFQIYRISDIMLIKAEALNQIGGEQEAYKIVMDIREKRNALAATKLDITDTDTEGINQFILEERAREFAFEGKRWFDLLRNAKRNNYDNISILVEVISKITDSKVQQSAINKIRDVNSHYLPIAETELFADTKLTQNPFYIK